MALVEDNHVIQTLLANATNDTFDIGILPRTPRWRPCQNLNLRSTLGIMRYSESQMLAIDIWTPAIARLEIVKSEVEPSALALEAS